MKVFDVHTHPDKHVNGRLFNELPDFFNYARSLGVDRLMTLGDVLRYGQVPNEEQIREINDSSWSHLERYPHILTGLCFINALADEGFIREEVYRCVRDGPFVGLKFEFPNAARKELDRVMPLAEELGVPVLQHSWDLTWNQQKDLQSDPRDVAVLARRYPRVKILMAHLTGSWLRGIHEVEDLPNVWVDTSGSQPFSSIIEEAVRILGEDRVLFGSDAPMRDLATQLGRILAADISESARAKVLYENAIQLWGLDP